MAKPNTSQEPSMEEILASIRRIISDDTPAPPAAAAPPPPAPEPKALAAATVSEDDLDKLFSQSDDDVMDLDEPQADESDDVLELTEDLAASDDLGLVEGLMPDEADVAFQEPMDEDMSFDDMDLDPEPAPPPKPQKPAIAAAPRPAAPEPMEFDEPLVSPKATASISAAFGSLNNTILSQNPRTLDDLVKEMLRPMLKDWLDENLPTMVERLVRAEIERVSRGR